MWLEPAYPQPTMRQVNVDTILARAYSFGSLGVSSPGTRKPFHVSPAHDVIRQVRLFRFLHPASQPAAPYDCRVPTEDMGPTDWCRWAPLPGKVIYIAGCLHHHHRRR